MSALMDKKGREAPPSQYLVKIKSLSLLSEASVETYESEEFEAGGYKWNLSIYLTGNKKADGQDYVSIYLVLRDPSSLPVGSVVNAIVNFSAYNFVEDKYVTTQDATVRSFHFLKTEWGVPKFIDLDTFNDPSKGYLVDDTCVFGAEVFILNTTIKGDCLSMIRKPPIVSYSWKFENFSFANCKMYESLPFVDGNYKWKIHFYPDGTHEGSGNSISLFLALDVSSSSLSSNTKLFVDYTLRAKDQISGQHAIFGDRGVFSNSCLTWGLRRFMPLAKFKDPDGGFLKEDSCILEAEVKVIGLITSLAD